MGCIRSVVGLIRNEVGLIRSEVVLIRSLGGLDPQRGWHDS